MDIKDIPWYDGPEWDISNINYLKIDKLNLLCLEFSVLSGMTKN